MPVGLEHMASFFPDILDDDMHSEQRKKMLNIAKMIMFLFGHSLRILEDKRSGKDMLFDIKVIFFCMHTLLIGVMFSNEVAQWSLVFLFCIFILGT